MYMRLLETTTRKQEMNSRDVTVIEDVHMPNYALFDDEIQYEELQISTIPPIASKKQSSLPTIQHAIQSVDSTTVTC